jgi:hypothetical protein
MKQKMVRVVAKDPKDDKQAKLMEKFLEHELEEHKEIIDAIMRARSFMIMAYGITPPDSIFDNILEAHVRTIWKIQGDKNEK